MYLLRLTCPAEHIDDICGQLWETGAVGIQEIDEGHRVILIAGFEDNVNRRELLARFRLHLPEWQQADATDWVEHTRQAWPARTVGERLVLVPPWSTDPTPPGRARIIHNPGLACGTGEHPCTQLALRALEKCVTPRSKVIDIGTGSGILAIAALRLGAEVACGFDTDLTALDAARENFLLNELTPMLVAGSADSIDDASSEITVANISGTVLLSILEDLMRITRANGWLILTGFPESEAGTFRQLFPSAEISSLEEWQCAIVTL